MCLRQYRVCIDHDGQVIEGVLQVEGQTFPMPTTHPTLTADFSGQQIQFDYSAVRGFKPLEAQTDGQKR